MALAQFCDPDEVRAALGMNSEELPDATLTLPIYEIGLLRELERVSTALLAIYYATLAVPEGSRSALQQKLVDAVHIFAVYAVAKQVGPSLGLMAAKSISDGEATTVRFSDAPYKDMLERIGGQYSVSRGDLLANFSAFNGVSLVSPSMFVGFIASKRGVDVITGV